MSNVLIAGGTFVTVEEGGTSMVMLAGKIAPGASHDSAERRNPPQCHPETRKGTIKTIMDWLESIGESERRYFMWLYGAAGGGKSAMAQTIAERCHELKILVASFFFSRTVKGRNDDSRLIATLAYQLCISIPEIRPYVERAIRLDPNIFSSSVKTQLWKLITEPLSNLRENPDPHIQSRLIIIDGLDECSSAMDVQRWVLQTFADKSPVPMFFLVVSRPEPTIREFFTTEPMASVTTTLPLDDSCQPEDDIRVFVKAKFDAIKRDHQLRPGLQSWPSPANIEYLVRKSSGQFIYVSTVMKYIESRRHSPMERLKVILGIISHGKDTPYADLDALYTHIFSSVADIDKVKDVFSVLLLVNTPSFVKSSDSIEKFLGRPEDELRTTLTDLHSILDIPTHPNQIRVLHASLGEFLLDQARSGDYYIDQAQAHARLTQHLTRSIPHTIPDEASMSFFSFFQGSPNSEKKLSHSDETISHSIFPALLPVHCVQSYPAAKLLDALWNLNASVFWKLYYSRPFDHCPLALLLDFFTWLKDKVCHPSSYTC